jgi:D-threo-aldose 1-dehydrogenase
VGIGAAPLAGLFAAVPEPTALGTITLALEAGVRLFDTAPLYGYGQSESRLGRGLAAWNRDELIVCTKVGRLLRDASIRPDDFAWKGVPAREAYFDFSRSAAVTSLEESLGRLGLDRVDLVHIHDPDDHFEAALEGSYSALSELRAAGRIRWIGVGANRIDIQLRFMESAEIDCLLVAGRYTLLDHTRSLRELFPVTEQRGVSVIIGGVFNSGVLTNPVAGATFDYEPAAREIIQRAQSIGAVCSTHGVPLKAAALQFPLAHPAVSCLLLGTRSPEELRESLALLEFDIPAALWIELKERRLIAAECPVP